jgi:hypothetical protein
MRTARNSKEHGIRKDNNMVKFFAILEFAAFADVVGDVDSRGFSSDMLYE